MGSWGQRLIDKFVDLLGTGNAHMVLAIQVINPGMPKRRLAGAVNGGFGRVLANCTANMSPTLAPTFGSIAEGNVSPQCSAETDWQWTDELKFQLFTRHGF